MRQIILSILLVLTTSQALAGKADWVGNTLEGWPCTSTEHGFGPFDYTNRQHTGKNLGVVEAFHFTNDVEQLRGGKSGHLHRDLDYTLRAFPNHHRALYALIRYYVRIGAEKYKTFQIPPPECYLQRAIAFQPKDASVFALFGLYMHKIEKYPEAEAFYKKSLEMMSNQADTHYNLALLLLDQKRFEEAREAARQAYSLGYPLAGARQRLQDAGYPL